MRLQIQPHLADLVEDSVQPLAFDLAAGRRGARR